MRASWITLVLSLSLTSLAYAEEGAGHPASKRGISIYLDPQHTASAHDDISTDELGKFLPGKPQNAVLNEVQWRGAFFMISDVEGQEKSAILYNVLPAGADEDALGIWAYAIFQEGKFVKFVEHKFQGDKREKLPEKFLDEMKDEDKHVFPQLKAVRIGDAALLQLLAEADSLSAPELKRQAVAAGTAPRSVDPGLTAVVLGLKALGLDPVPNHVDDYRSNAKLRDQFNGSRLRIGMSSERVEKLFRSEPLDTGAIQGGTYKLFGKPLTESLNVRPKLVYQNVLTLFDHNGNLKWAISVSPYEDWKDEVAFE